MKLTSEQLKRIYPAASLKNIERYLPWFNYFLPFYDIDTLPRMAAFLAQIGHESVQLTYTKEIASGKAYEGREDLGNIHSGDGVRFKGRGLIQITGRTNYELLSKDLDVDFIEHPELLSEPQYAVACACWFWDKRKLNNWATLKEEDFRKITKLINGGYNGYGDRFKLWANAKEVLSKS